MVAVISESGRATERDDQDADADHDQRQGAEARQQKGHDAIDLALPGDLAAAFGIDLGQRLEVLVECGTHRAVGVVVAPFAARGGIDLDPAANQFLAEFDELLDAFLEGGELPGVVGLDDGFPVLDHGKDLVVELEQPGTILLHVGGLRRHVDAAGFHHDGIDQRIDAFDVECGAVGRLDRVGQFGVPAGVEIRQNGDRRGQERDQAEDRVELGCERKPGCHGVAGRTGGLRRFRHRTVSLGEAGQRRRPRKIMQKLGVYVVKLSREA
jgi:hypothetical protein